MSIESFDRATIRRIAEEAQELLAPLAEKYGIEVKVGGGTFSSDDFTTKVTFKVEGAGEAEFARHAPLVGLEASDLGRTFNSNGQYFKVVGINLRAPKYPIKVKSGTKTYKMTEATVKAALAKARV